MSECSTDRLSLSLETLRGCIARMGQAGGPDGQPRLSRARIGRKPKRAATEVTALLRPPRPPVFAPNGSAGWRGA